MNELEDRLRSALEARAHTYEASPQAWIKVRGRTLRTQRRWIWLLALVPLAAATAVLPIYQATGGEQKGQVSTDVVTARPTTTSDRDTHTLGPYGYGAVKLGMTVKQAKATGDVRFGGDPMVDLDGLCFGAELRRFGSPANDWGIYVSRRLGLAAIWAPNDDMKTPEGIKVGSTAKELKAAYPHMKKKDIYGWYVIAVPGNKKAYYSVSVWKGKVMRLGIALRKQDCFIQPPE